MIRVVLETKLQINRLKKQVEWRKKMVKLRILKAMNFCIQRSEKGDVHLDNLFFNKCNINVYLLKIEQEVEIEFIAFMQYNSLDSNFIYKFIIKYFFIIISKEF